MNMTKPGDAGYTGDCATPVHLAVLKKTRSSNAIVYQAMNARQRTMQLSSNQATQSFTKRRTPGNERRNCPAITSNKNARLRNSEYFFVRNKFPANLKTLTSSILISELFPPSTDLLHSYLLQISFFKQLHHFSSHPALIQISHSQVYLPDPTSHSSISYVFLLQI